MRNVLRHAAVSAVLAGLIVAGMAVAATAAPPERETITFSETFPDLFLMEVCGLDDVTTTVTFQVTTLTFQDRPVGLQSLGSVHVDIVSTAGENSVMLKNVGMNSIQVTPEGEIMEMIAGQVPFHFTGALRLNLTTGELILEPHTVDETRACRLLRR